MRCYSIRWKRLWMLPSVMARAAPYLPVIESSSTYIRPKHFSKVSINTGQCMLLLLDTRSNIPHKLSTDFPTIRHHYKYPQNSSKFTRKRLWADRRWSCLRSKAIAHHTIEKLVIESPYRPKNWHSVI